MAQALHIVEPTLNNHAGHCHSLVEACAAATGSVEPTIWAGRNSVGVWQGRGHIEPYFRRSLRRVQTFFLLRRLLREPGRVLISTAGTSDLLAADMAARDTIPPGKLYFYFHWLGGKASKAGKLARIAARQPNLEILAPTATVADFFRDVGFRARIVPYPVPRLEDAAGEAARIASFRHLVVAGAARLDKGFDRIVDLVAELARREARLPISVQASATHRDRHSPEIEREIARLCEAAYPALVLHTGTLEPAAYREAFRGGISVQPYLAADFSDRVSGVTLDALSAGCPVVVTAGTWMARVVEDHRAGVATADLSPAGLIQAIDTILADYPAYAARAAEAGRDLQNRHSAERMIDAIFGPPS